MTTVGVEEEFHLVDRRTGQLTPAAASVLELLPAQRFTPESKATTIEVNSLPHTDLVALHDDIVAGRSLLVEAANRRGIAPIASGTAPIARLTDSVTTPGSRYAAIDHKFARLSDEQLICGLHVHVGIEDRDVAAASTVWISPWVPVLLALSAGSPYWLGTETGYASWRTMLWQRWPTAGPLPWCRSAAEYDELVASLIGSGVITDAGMMYHDIRLSAHVPTLELRVCDAVPDVDVVVAIAALFRALVRHSASTVLAGREPRPVPDALLRLATWRAARSGLEGDLIDPETSGRARAGSVVRKLLAVVEEDLRWYGDWDRVTDAVEHLLHRGSWAAVQRRVGRREGLPAVVHMLGEATRSQRPRRSAAAHVTDAA